MDRRDFVQGLITSAFGGKMILEASPSEVARFGVGDRVSANKIAPPELGANMEPYLEHGIRGGMWMLYNYEGKAVAAVKNVEVQASRFDATPDYSTVRQVMAGPTRIDITAVGLGEDCFKWLQDCDRIARERDKRERG